MDHAVPSLVAAKERESAPIRPLDFPAFPVPMELSHVDPSFLIPSDSLQLAERLGEGNFGTVMRAVWNGCTDVAVKIVSADRSTPSQLVAFQREVMLCAKIRPHPNVVQFFGLAKEGSELRLVLEFAENGDLEHFLRGDAGMALTTPQLLCIGKQVAAGMNHLHSLNVVHRDLAPRNVLVFGWSGADDCYVVKVSDFGLSRMGHSGYVSQTKGNEIPLLCTAPEALAGKPFTTKSDVWSFGMALFSIITKGKPPYPGLPLREVYSLILNGVQPHRPPECPPNVYELLTRCWKFEPAERCTMRELYAHLKQLSELARLTGPPAGASAAHTTSNAGTSAPAALGGPVLVPLAPPSALSASGGMYVKEERVVRAAPSANSPLPHLVKPRSPLSASTGGDRVPTKSGLVIIDDYGTIQSADENCSALFGYSMDEMVGQNVNMLMPSPYAEQHDTYLSNYRNTGEKRIIGRTRMVEAKHKDGMTFRTLLSVSEVATDSGTLFLGSLERAEDSSVVVTSTLKGAIVSVNAKVEDLFGWKPSELVGKNVSVLMPEPFRSAHDGYMERWRTTGEKKVLDKVRNLNAQHRNGSLFPISLLVRHVKIGDLQLLRANIERVSCDVEVVFTLGSQGIIESTNKLLAQAVLGKSENELIGQHIASLLPELGFTQQTSSNSASSTSSASSDDSWNEEQRTERKVRHADGSSFPAILEVHQFRDAAGEHKYSVRLQRLAAGSSSHPPVASDVITSNSTSPSPSSTASTSGDPSVEIPVLSQPHAHS